MDDWENVAGRKLIFAIAQAIVDAGYKGVWIEILGQIDDGELAWTIYQDPRTPEGRMVRCLMNLAAVGKDLCPPYQALAMLDQAYRDQGLQLPKRQV